VQPSRAFVKLHCKDGVHAQESSVRISLLHCHTSSTAAVSMASLPKIVHWSCAANNFRHRFSLYKAQCMSCVVQRLQLACSAMASADHGSRVNQLAAAGCLVQSLQHKNIEQWELRSARNLPL
jgi:hypothetical protein